MTDRAICKVGTYRGELWDSIPEAYLYWMVNNRKGDLADQCRKEVVRRLALRGKPDPWLKRDHEKANA